MGDKASSHQLGYIKRSARTLNVPVDSYLAEIRDGRKWCSRCREWHPRSDFGLDKHQGDGLNSSCRISRRVLVKRYRGQTHLLGKKLPAETRAKMSAARSGEKNHKWQGGITPAIRRARQHAEYQRWRRAVLRRDSHRCVQCGDRNRLHVHHVKSFRDHPELRLEVSNGLTFCDKHHRAIHAGGTM